MKTSVLISAIIIMALVAIAASAHTPKPSAKTVGELIRQANDFSFVRTHRQGKNGVAITWTFATNDASGFMVERTYEDPTDPYATWTEVSSAPCNGSRSYKCTDEAVFPGYVHYRVTAMMNYGGTVISPTSTIRIVQH